MGAVEFTELLEGFSAKDAFNMACETARSLFGCDPYNGTISTCSLGSGRRIGNGYYSPENLKKAEEILEKNPNQMRKRVACYFDLGIAFQEVYEIKKDIPKEPVNAKYLTRHAVVLDLYPDEGGQIICSKATKKEAEDACKELLLKNPRNMYCVRKMPVNMNNGNNMESVFHMEKKRLPVKGKILTSNNKRTVRAIHKYLFYGLAAE